MRVRPVCQRPSGLKQVNPQLSIVVLEKGAEVKAHILSGAVIDPIGIDRLSPGPREEERRPFKTKVTDDQFLPLGPAGSLRLPNFATPPLMNNHGNYSLGRCRALRLLSAGVYEWVEKEARTSLGSTRRTA